eukprot:15470956-Alexandrium_andersonii.AAC.1
MHPGAPHPPFRASVSKRLHADEAHRISEQHAEAVPGARRSVLGQPSGAWHIALATLEDSGPISGP